MGLSIVHAVPPDLSWPCQTFLLLKLRFGLNPHLKITRISQVSFLSIVSWPLQVKSMSEQWKLLFYSEWTKPKDCVLLLLWRQIHREALRNAWVNFPACSLFESSKNCFVGQMKVPLCLRTTQQCYFKLGGGNKSRQQHHNRNNKVYLWGNIGLYLGHHQQAPYRHRGVQPGGGGFILVWLLLNSLHHPVCIQPVSEQWNLSVGRGWHLYSRGAGVSCLLWQWVQMSLWNVLERWSLRNTWVERERFPFNIALEYGWEFSANLQFFCPANLATIEETWKPKTVLHMVWKFIFMFFQHMSLLSLVLIMTPVRISLELFVCMILTNLMNMNVAAGIATYLILMEVTCVHQVSSAVTIFPDTLCIVPLPVWSESSLSDERNFFLSLDGDISGW